ncbi:DEAD/DEAH box helicase family protein [Acuticoccus sp. MNP-M23]|uniref:DEAD/DEAH box helicase family protein n=1 Tax=Acuticoccus sp. MNP-M23 TaxID=3072793 RepID=UPI002815DC39|nr:DEAD/DEAH box helicase family protein [Acuticoccus sp. MNP-M23]WMS40827.1 DEAD/DEAH box helicase family protein [Acuticoccus sp. MNP-M23]
MKTDIDNFLDLARRFHARRGGGNLTPTMLKTGKALYHFFNQAQKDAETGIKRMQVAAAPTGSGKSTATLAYAAHLWSTQGKTTVILVDTIQQAENIWQDARHLFAEEEAFRSTVNVFTSMHRVDTDPRRRETDCQSYGIRPTNPPIALNDTVREGVAVLGLPEWPILIATQRFWVGKNGWKATEGRSLIVLDEWTGRVENYSLAIGDLNRLRNLYDRTMLVDEETRDQTSLDLEEISGLIDAAYTEVKGEAGHKGRYVPLPVDRSEAVSRVADRWLAEKDKALTPLQKAGKELVENAMGFIVALDKGQVVKARHQPDRGYGGQFVGYCVSYEIQPGIVLLDATGRLDGIDQFTSWRSSECAEVPVIDYCNLQPVIVDKPKALVDPKTLYVKEIVENEDGALDVWKDWVLWLIRSTMHGDHATGLVVLPKALENHFPRALREEFGDRLSVIHWGQHVGSNEWKTADAVYLLEEFHQPRDVHISHVRALQDDEEDRRPTAENLKDAQGPSLRGDYDAYQDGQLLASMVQAASRGNVRNPDADGRCGEMRLYVAGQIFRLDRHLRTGFPGHRPVRFIAYDEGSTGRLRTAKGILERLLGFFIREKAGGVSEVTYNDISAACRVPRRKVTERLSLPKVVEWMEANGAERVAPLGRGKVGKVVFSST